MTGARDSAAGAAIAVTALLLAVILYVASFLGLLAVFSSLVDDGLNRDRFWKYVIYWAVYQLPMIWTFPIAALLTRAFWRGARSAGGYWALTGLASVAFIVLSLMYLASGGGRGVVLIVLLAAMLYPGWRLMRALLRPKDAPRAA